MSLGEIRRADRLERWSNATGVRASATVLAVLCALLMSVLLAAAAPAFAAEAPGAPGAPPRDALTTDNTGNVSVHLEGSRATVEVDADRVYAYVYPGSDQPVDVGWQEPEGSVFDVDLSLMPAGDVTVAVLDESGDLLGWGVAELSASDSHAPVTADAPDGSAFPWPVLLWILAGAVLVLGVVVLLLLLVRRRAGRSAKPGADRAIGPEA